ncbi:hypothetical protein LNV09_14760 [Paucibacter sp. B2R-40]|uniref:DUF6710 family protein n=1 Tax=Paucibacter sp. B2R-40 TaxID=2893554 RepID=UPI0021E442E2|nr:DUF6710 family protein [Paucibacter sp. B2R-40]MCV2355413.1 hypothetical protein [Paucibacter sp. B2R-40]
MLWSIDSAQANGKHALRGLAVALSQIIRARALETLLMDAREFHKPSLDAEDLLWDDSLPLNAEGDTRASLMRKASRTLSVELNDAIVFPAPWERWRLFKAFQNMGEKREWGAWRQDSNHFGIAWKPWPIVWVSNGNHSTMAALIRGGGKFKCHEAYDFSPVLQAVRTDGVNWIRIDTEEVLSPVRSLPMAGIFEIGRRLMTKPLDMAEDAVPT